MIRPLGFIEEGGQHALTVLVPKHLHEGILAYIEGGRRTGGFLEAVISGDLFEAAQRADFICSRVLADIARWFVQYAPASCYGSREVYETWVKKGETRE
jgi:hypothetical protein